MISTRGWGPERTGPVLREPEMRAMFTEDLRMSLGQGAVGNLYDLALFARPWGVLAEGHSSSDPHLAR